MSTETITAPAAAPELSIFHRVYSIPIVADSLATIHSSLSNNSYTRSPYVAAQSLGGKAYSFSEPIQARLAPVLTRADGLANKGLDVVESRYPYPFQTPTQDIYRDIKQNTDQAVDVANKTIDLRIRTPAYGIAQGLDQRLAPLVDQYAVVLTRFAGQQPQSPVSSTPESTELATSSSQVERAYRLTVDLRDQIYNLSSDQLKQLQTQNAYVQRATETIHNLNGLLASSYSNIRGKGVSLGKETQSRIQVLSHNLVQELEKIQAATASLPSHLQARLEPVQAGFKSTITEISTILRSDIPVSEKTSKIGSMVQTQVQPVLDSTLDVVHAYAEASRKYIGLSVEEIKPAVEETEATIDAHVNGNGNGAAANGNGNGHT